MIRKVLALSLLAFAAVATPAFADAPDPIPAQTHLVGSVHNADGSVTITIAGAWQWPTHKSDCNTNRAGAGYAIAWNDPSDPGNFVGTNTLNTRVGTSLDNTVHAVPGGMVTPVDVSSPSQYQLWRGGCGTFNGTFNSGTWGPISHTYPAGTGAITVCPIMYDVHGSSAGTAPNGAKEITAGASGWNTDNSIQSNGDTPLGNGCFASTFPALSTTATPTATVGTAIHDVAHLQGSNPTGTITFKLYPAGDTSCAQAPIFDSSSSPVTVNGNGDYRSPTPDFVSSNVGSYNWRAFYSGDAHNQATSTPCGDSNETTTVNPATPQIATTATPSGAAVGTTVGDQVTITGGFPDGHPSGTVNWQLVDSSCNAVIGVSSSTAVNQNTTYPLTSPNMTAPNTTGTYYWTAKFTPSNGNNDTVGPVGCNDPAERLTVNSSPNMQVTKFERDATSGGSLVSDPNTVTGAVGDTIQYEMEVDNKGNVSLNLSANDPRCDSSPLSGPFTSSSNSTPLNGALAAGSSAFYTCSHVLTNADIGSTAQPGTGYTNTINVTGTPPPGQGSAITGSSSVTAFARGVPAYTITKRQTIEGSGQPFTTATLTGLQGQTVDYEITVTNTGNVPLTFSAFSDPMCDAGTIAGGPGNVPVQPGASTVWTCAHQITAADQANGSVTNIATVTGTPPGGPPTTTPSNPVVVNVPSPGITILKQQQIGNTGGFTSNTLTGNAGDTVNYKMIVSNTGGTALALSLDDPHCDPGTVTGPFAISGNLSGSTLAAGGQAYFLCSHVLLATDRPTFTNTATVTGNPPSGPPVTSPPSSVTVNLNPPPNSPTPGLNVVKSQTVSGSNQPYTTSPVTATAGQTVLYHMTVTNTGNTPLALNFSDPHCDANTLTGPSGGLDANGQLAVGASTLYSCSHLIAASDAPAFTNVVTVTGTPPGGTPTPPVSSQVVANVPQQVVSPSCVAGSVALRGTVGCARRAFQAVVQAAPNSVKSVTFLLDGKVIKTLTHVGAGNRWAIMINPGKLRFGGHTLTARVTLICNGTRRVATLHFRHCKPPKPRFTG